jgi:hypothetical protein
MGGSEIIQADDLVHAAARVLQLDPIDAVIVGCPSSQLSPALVRKKSKCGLYDDLFIGINF